MGDMEAVGHLQVLNALAHLHDRTSRLVADDHGLVHHEPSYVTLRTRALTVNCSDHLPKTQNIDKMSGHCNTTIENPLVVTCMQAVSIIAKRIVYQGAGSAATAAPAKS